MIIKSKRHEDQLPDAFLIEWDCLQGPFTFAVEPARYKSRSGNSPSHLVYLLIGDGRFRRAGSGWLRIQTRGERKNRPFMSITLNKLKTKPIHLIILFDGDEARIVFRRRQKR